MSTENEEKKQKRKNAWKNLPDVWALIKPRRGLLALGFVLMAVNRVAGLVLPASTKYFVDNVISKRQVELLTPIVLAVLAATLLQGLTSFTLTQLLSKSAQKMITELRRQVQAHIGRLSVSFYDANKTGVLVSRIMSDVEGVRNLIGTGLVEFVGGLMTAIFALVYLIHTSVMMTALAFGILLVFGGFINKAFKTIRPIFRARPKINAEVTGRLTESLGGVRVVKGYHAEEREEKVFSAGVQRLLDNVLKTLTATSLMSLSGAGLMGLVSALIMEFGGHKVLSGSMTLGQFFAFNVFLGLLVAPVFQIVAIGTQITEAITGLERTREILNETQEDADPRRTVTLDRITGYVAMENVTFAYDTRKEVLHDVSFQSEPGTVTALVGPSGAGKSTLLHILGMYDSAWTGEFYFLDTPVHRLKPKDRNELIKLLNGGVQQVRVVLRALALLQLAKGASAPRISEVVPLTPQAIRKVGHRYQKGGLEPALYEKQRPGAAAVLDNSQKQRIIAMVCSDPPEGRARWTVRLVAEEFRNLKKLPVTEEELRRAKDHLKGSLMLSLESTSSRMSRLARQAIYFDRFFTLDEMLASIEGVTREDVQQIALEFFNPKRIGVTILGNLGGLNVTRDLLAC